MLDWSAADRRAAVSSCGIGFVAILTTAGCTAAAVGVGVGALNPMMIIRGTSISRRIFMCAATSFSGNNPRLARGLERSRFKSEACAPAALGPSVPSADLRGSGDTQQDSLLDFSSISGKLYAYAYKS